MRVADHLRSLIAYNQWANDRVLVAAKQLTDDELDEELGGSWGTVRANLYHLVGAQMSWFNQFVGERRRELSKFSYLSTAVAPRSAGQAS